MAKTSIKDGKEDLSMGAKDKSRKLTRRRSDSDVELSRYHKLLLAPCHHTIRKEDWTILKQGSVGDTVRWETQSPEPVMACEWMDVTRMKALTKVIRIFCGNSIGTWITFKFS